MKESRVDEQLPRASVGWTACCHHKRRWFSKLLTRKRLRGANQKSLPSAYSVDPVDPVDPTEAVDRSTYQQKCLNSRTNYRSRPGPGPGLEWLVADYKYISRDKLEMINLSSCFWFRFLFVFFFLLLFFFLVGSLTDLFSGNDDDDDGVCKRSRFSLDFVIPHAICFD